jgi:hypothetical protein
LKTGTHSGKLIRSFTTGKSWHAVHTKTIHGKSSSTGIDPGTAPAPATAIGTDTATAAANNENSGGPSTAFPRCEKLAASITGQVLMCLSALLGKDPPGTGDPAANRGTGTSNALRPSPSALYISQDYGSNWRWSQPVDLAAVQFPDSLLREFNLEKRECGEYYRFPSTSAGLTAEDKAIEGFFLP